MNISKQQNQLEAMKELKSDADSHSWSEPTRDDAPQLCCIKESLRCKQEKFRHIEEVLVTSIYEYINVIFFWDSKIYF